jgi:signal transduction histidine kinase
MPQFGRDLVWAATAMALFGIVGQVFVRQTDLVPSTVLNSAAFLQWFGIPIQLFRAVTAAAMTWFITRALNAFEVENRRQFDAAIDAKAQAQETQLASERRDRQEIEHLFREVQGREDRLGQLLRRVVSAQEAERQRIARELHDATGQSLTAISLGLRGVETLANNEASPVAAQVHELGAMSTQALGELRQIIADLRPSHLDDLGLAPTLRWYLKQYEARWRIRTQLIVGAEQMRLPAEYETVLFRITQEALNNVAKHAQAQNVTVTLALKSPEATLMVEDDGCGFDPAAVQPGDGRQGGWGLMGIRERATLVGGRVEILSRPGQGTRLIVSLPLPLESQHAGQEDRTAVGG